MKLLALLLLLSIFTSAGAAQEPVPEPEFADVVFRLDAGGLVPLERQTAAIQGKASGFIAMSMKASSEFPGVESPVRFFADQPLIFVVRSPSASSTTDPNTLYVLRKLNIKKKSRELIIMGDHASPVGASTKTNLAEGVLPVTFSRFYCWGERKGLSAHRVDRL